MKRSSIQFQLATLVSVTIGITLALLFVLSLSETNSLLAEQEANVDSEFVHSIREVMESRLDQAEPALRLVTADPEFRRLVAERDREGLIAHLSGPWEEVKGLVARFHIHLPNSTSLLRMHAVDRFGDDLTSLRPMVNAVNARREPLRGIEVGVHGLSQRVVRPVEWDGQHVGSAEFGLLFNNEQLQVFEERRPADYSLYRFGADGNALVASTATDNPCPIGPDGLARIRNGDVYSTTSCSLRDHVLAVPLHDYSGSVVAYLKVVSDRSALESGLRTMRYRLSMLAIGAVIVIPMLVWLALGRLLTPLSAIVEQTHNIADRIAAGDHEYRGDVEASTSDFREIIVEINRIIAAFRASEAQKQAILDGFPGMLYLVDGELIIVWANEFALQRRPDMIGRNCRCDSCDDEVFVCEESILLDTLRSGRIERGSSGFSPEDGTDREWWEYVAVPISHSGAEVEHVVMIAWDVTDKTRAQHALEELNETLEQRVREEVRARELQEQMVFQQAKLAAIGELAAGIAHEVNQPLNTLTFAFENLARRVADSCVDYTELDAKRRTIAAGLERIRHILDHVRSFSREQLREFSEPFNVNDAVHHAVSMIEAQLRAHGVEIEVGYADADAISTGNEYELEQVILNLCSNARYAVERRQEPAADTPRVAIDVAAEEEWVVVTVSDNGDGIPDEIRGRVMDPFFTTKGPQEGTGLGLSISYGIVQKMAGRLEIESWPGKGTRVAVIVPRRLKEPRLATGEAT